MTAIREQLCAGIEAAAGEITGVSEVEWDPSGDPVSFPALHFFDDGQGPEPQQEAGTSRYKLRLGILGFVEGGDGSSARTALNELYNKAVTMVMAFSDESIFVEEAVEGDMQVQTAELASERRASFSLEFELTYVTRRGNPSAL